MTIDTTAILTACIGGAGVLIAPGVGQKFGTLGPAQTPALLNLLPCRTGCLG